MKAPSRKTPPTFGAFIARVYDAYFPHDDDYHGDTDADHAPAIPGNYFTEDARPQDEFRRQGPAPGDAERDPMPFGWQPES